MSSTPTPKFQAQSNDLFGTEVNSMRLNSSLFDNDNRAGFTGGVQVEFTVPVINLGFDAGVQTHGVDFGTYARTDAELSRRGQAGNSSKGYCCKHDFKCFHK